MSQKRLWLLVIPRIDSRLFLKGLIGFNVVLAIYNIFALQTSNQKTSPCVVVINTSKGALHVDNRFITNGTKNFNAGLVVPFAASQSRQNNVSYIPSQQVSINSSLLMSEDTTRRIAWWSTEMRGSYGVIRDYIKSDLTAKFNNSVTLSTQGTYEFLYHSEMLCKKWDGFISLAVYAPGDDFIIALNIIYYLRKCRNSCIRNYISWHLIFDASLGPGFGKITFPDILVNMSADICLVKFEEFLGIFKSNFRVEHKLPYPINVVRNVARLSSKTKYLLASDIELYPSSNIVAMFLDLKRREAEGRARNVQVNVSRVYVLPIFEVKAGLTPPATKLELVDMIRKGDAIFFHKWVCDSCQNFPDRDKWILSEPINGTLNVFVSTKRLRSRSTWEPLYIGTNEEPLYDERLSWDGKRDKMSQMYEMCLKAYDMLILDNAFLVHAPGIKHIDPQDQKRRLPFIKRNNLVYNTILAKLRKKYGTKNNC